MESIDVQQKDAQRKHLKTVWRLLGVILAVVLFTVAVVAVYSARRFQPEKHAVHRVFRAVEAKQFELAYGIYQADLDWQRHPERYTYTYNQFYLDWGYSGDFGVITSHEIECAMPPKAGSARESAPDEDRVIVVVRINHRVDGIRSFWVRKDTKTIEPTVRPVTCQ